MRHTPAEWHGATPARECDPDEPIDFSIAAMYAAPTKPTQSPKPTPAEPLPLVARCAQCGHAYGIAYHTRSIYRRGRGWSDERFCSEDCGANYQMGCE